MSHPASGHGANSIHMITGSLRAPTHAEDVMQMKTILEILEDCDKCVPRSIAQSMQTSDSIAFHISIRPQAGKKPTHYGHFTFRTMKDLTAIC